MKKEAQNNSVFARIYSKYQRLIITACFISWYLMLWYYGSHLFYCWSILFEGGKKLPLKLPFFIITGLIILVSSMLSRMYLNWSRELRESRKGNNGGGPPMAE
jgi:hypothetical protein